ncbi:MAG: hypothetical protein RLZZ360_805 [Candidatus Parcubacteria bacterium]|jgi:chlorophyll synthase
MWILKVWIITSRPLLYPLVPVIFILGYQAGGGELLDWQISEWLFVAALTWPLTMIVYGINDLTDVHSDRHDTKRSRLDGGIADLDSIRSIRTGVGLAAALLFGISSYALGWYGFIFTVFVLLASVVYSVPPIRLKSRAGLDVLFSGFVYVICMYGAGYWLVQPLALLPNAAYILALFAVCLHALGTLRDYTVDKATGEKTFAVMLGPRKSTLLVAILASSGIVLWYVDRGFDLAANLVFLSILLPALLTIHQPNEHLIRVSMRVIAVIVGLVGLYKIFF